MDARTNAERVQRNMKQVDREMQVWDGRFRLSGVYHELSSTRYEEFRLVREPRIKRSQSKCSNENDNGVRKNLLHCK